MVKRCAYGQCNSDSRYGPSGKRPRPDMEGVIFYPIPMGKNDEDRRRAWIKSCAREGFGANNVGRGHFVCSKHFVEGQPTMTYPNPIPGNATQLEIDNFLRQKGRKGPTRMTLIPEKRMVFSKAPKTTPAVDKNEQVSDIAHEEEVGEGEDDHQNSVILDLDLEAGVFETVLQPKPGPDGKASDNDHAEEVCPKADNQQGSVSLGFDVKEAVLETVLQPQPPSFSQVSTMTNVDSLNIPRSTADSGTQTNIKFDDINEYSDAELTNKASMKRWHIKHDVFKSDEACQFYTGLTCLKLMHIFSFIKEKAEQLRLWRGYKESNQEKHFTRGRILGTWEELMICLMRLRRGLQLRHIGDMFGVSTTLVGRICLTYTQFLRRELEFVIRWPSLEQIRQNPPPSFKYFPRTRGLIDCTEFFIQRPSLPSSQRKTWSSYKHHNTFKLLVATTPRGTFSFVSDLWTGNVSDRRITQLSGFLDKVEFNDDIMADRGFLIRDLLALRGATLNMPPFAHGRQLSHAATTKTRRIARARINVEMAIGRLKRFHILSQVIPLSLKGQMNDIVKLCAILCNLDTVLVKTR